MAQKLTDEQKATLHQWAAEGADLNQIQDRLKEEMGITLTFMDTRFLAQDLQLVIGQPEPEPEETVAEDTVEADWDGPPTNADGTSPSGGVSVSVDVITIPGATVSGKVKFSDGIQASWYLDQAGRLGLSGVERTYQPPVEDMPYFQAELRRSLQKLGY
jgi:hypothetical protein